MQLAPGAPPATAAGGRRIAVALHDIEPATFERCALIRDWLDDHGVDRVTLLVMPARDLHPLGERCRGIRRGLDRELCARPQGGDAQLFAGLVSTSCGEAKCEHGPRGGEPRGSREHQQSGEHRFASSTGEIFIN
jgi:hypothetical protein